jgi:hypothetical protein
MTTISELVLQLGSNDQVQAYQARRQLSTEVDRATNPATPSEREVLASALAAELTATTDDPPAEQQVTNVPGSETVGPRPKHSAEIRRVLCQLLCQIVSDAQMPAVLLALQDLQVREAARGVMEYISTPPADIALAQALTQVGPDFRIGVVNALAKQRSREALAFLSRYANDPENEVRLAAIEGLARFPEAANDKLIVAATQSGSRRDKARAQHARVRLAETLRNAGEKRDAAAIYQAIASDPSDGPWKMAARRALEQMKAKVV